MQAKTDRWKDYRASAEVSAIKAPEQDTDMLDEFVNGGEPSAADAAGA